MTRKTISNTFTVNTIIDGESAPYYFQEWFAWSNDATTASVTTEPTIGGSWATSIPAQESYAYLWRKVVRHVLNNDGQTYTPETAQYFRMSGLNGTSIKTKGSVIAVISRRGTFPTTGVEDGDIVIKDSDRTPYRATIRGMIVTWDAMSNADDGDSYTVIKTCYYSPTDELDAPDVKGHLFSYSEEASKWLDLGKFQGENGETWYNHVAWATNVDTSTTPITVTGFVTTKSPNDTTHIWMGVLVDQNSGQDSQNATLYTWSNTKGDGAAVATCSPDKISIQCNADGSVVSAAGYSASFGLKVGSIDLTQYITNVTHGSLPTGVSITSTPVASSKTIVVSNTATATGMASGITFTVTGTYEGKTYSSTVNVALIGAKQGSVGERGNVGRFYYYAGDWDATNSTTLFVINDAQAPFFSKAGSSSNAYYVYNPDDNPSGGEMTMAQMAEATSSGRVINWNNKPWEVMTNDFKYIITEALFGAYAHLGSWIFNGDYMLSQTGVDGTTNYQNFTGESGAWQPNLYMNAKAGKIVANSGVIGGFTINTSQIKSANSNIILNSDGSAKIGGFDIATNGSARLKNTLSVGNANSQRIEIAPFAQGDFGAGSINFVNMNGEKVIVLGFNNNTYGHIDILKAATNQDVVESTMSINADSLQINSQNTDYNNDANINILTNSNNALSTFSYNEPTDTQKLFKCGIENKAITLRAYNSDGGSAWPSVAPQTGTKELTKGLVHVMSIASLKTILEDSSSYWYQWSKYYVLLVQHIN